MEMLLVNSYKSIINAIYTHIKLSVNLDMNGTQLPAEVPAAQPEPTTPPQLWGSDGASYPATVSVKFLILY